jgi:uncharacterized membrane protein YkoI
MRKRIVVIVIAVSAAAIVTGGAIAVATSDREGSVTGPEADRAAQAALDATGGGTVLEVERDDGGAAWEVEVRTPDGPVVEVRLDESLAVVSSGGDDGDAGEDDGTDDDGTENDGTDD